MTTRKWIFCAIALPLFAFAQPVLAATYAANCRYDTADRVSSGLLPGTTDTTPGEHYRMRLDIDTDRGTAIWSGDTGMWWISDYNGSRTWHRGDMWRASGKDVKVFVTADGRLVRFGTDTLNPDGSISGTDEYSLDLDSGLFTDSGKRRWDCEQAGNKFRN